MKNIPQSLQFLVNLILFILLFVAVSSCSKSKELNDAPAIAKNEPIATDNRPISRNADEYFFSESFKDLQEELETVEQEGKQGLFVFFDMQGCPYCIYMKEKVLNQIEVQNFYNQYFRSITIDIHASTEATDVDGTEMTEKEVAAKYSVDLTPTMIFFAPNGEELHRRIGILKTKEEVIAMAKEVLEFLPEQ